MMLEKQGACGEIGYTADIKPCKCGNPCNLLFAVNGFTRKYVRACSQSCADNVAAQNATHNAKRTRIQRPDGDWTITHYRRI